MLRVFELEIVGEDDGGRHIEARRPGGPIVKVPRGRLGPPPRTDELRLRLLAPMLGVWNAEGPALPEPLRAPRAVHLGEGRVFVGHGDDAWLLEVKTTVEPPY